MISFRRNLPALEAKEFDLLVIGGGIDGGTIAYEAALAGLTVALVDKKDFGSGATAGNFKTIHGGLRYLQHLDLKRLYQSVREQQILRRIAPHLTAPLPFLVPCYGFGMKGREVLNLALHLYEAMTFFRNHGVHPENHLTAHRMLSIQETKEIAPGIRENGLRGGVLFNDAQMINPERLTMAFIRSAVANGAVACNYVEVTGSTQRADGSIERVTCRDVLDGATVEVRARVTVNATGPWAKQVENRLSGSKALEPADRVFSKGLQLVFDPFITKAAVAVESFHADETAVVARGNRSYFLLPWQGRTLAGTADIAFTAEPDAYALEEEEIELFIQELRTAYSSPQISREHVKIVFGGLRPVEPAVVERYQAGKLERFGSIEASHRDTIRHVVAMRNLFTVIGVKYTTARAVAEDVVKTIATMSERVVNLGKGRTLPLIGGDIADLSSFKREKSRELVNAGVSENSAERLTTNYGSEVDTLLRMLREKPELARSVLDEESLLALEMAFAVEYECAQSVEDVVYRRSAVGTYRPVSGDELKLIGDLYSRRATL